MPVRSDTTNTEEIPAMIVDVTATAVAGVEQVCYEDVAW